jgi:hypothetical protein
MVFVRRFNKDKCEQLPKQYAAPLLLRDADQGVTKTHDLMHSTVVET